MVEVEDEVELVRMLVCEHMVEVDEVEPLLLELYDETELVDNDIIDDVDIEVARYVLYDDEVDDIVVNEKQKLHFAMVVVVDADCTAIYLELMYGMVLDELDDEDVVRLETVVDDIEVGVIVIEGLPQHIEVDEVEPD